MSDIDDIWDDDEDREQFVQQKQPPARRTAIMSTNPMPLDEAVKHLKQMIRDKDQYIYDITGVDEGDFTALGVALAALSQPQRVAPEGWKLVPVEPTREMWEAGGNAAVGKTNVHHDVVVGAVFHAMLAASPPAPAGGEGWMPISEAPRDGGPARVGWPGGSCNSMYGIAFVVGDLPNAGWLDDDGLLLEPQPTLYHPYPAAPQVREGGK